MIPVMPPGQVIVFFVGLIAIIFAAYYVTYYIGLKASGQSKGRLRNKNINVIDRFAVSRDKSFYLVEIAGKVYVVGVTNQTMTLLDTLDAAAFPEAAAEHRDMPQWRGAAGGRFTGPMTKKLAAFLAGKAGRAPENGERAGGSFTESMDRAREKARPGQPSSDDPERPGDRRG